MRGTRGQGRMVRHYRGIIPADAGNTALFDSLDEIHQDHPRGCGEHLTTLAGLCIAAGSSPRMRGTELEKPRDEDTLDHPRGCGEHLMICRRVIMFRGSSPRMRGTRHGVALMPDDVGIIPADAGNTNKPRYPRPSAEDHPRGCGEHHQRAGKRNREQGSSPRMRGTQPDPGV